MVTGVTTGFTKNLEISGVGYRAQLQGEKLVLALGYSHPVEVVPPAGIKFIVETPTRLAVNGADKELVGQVAADIRQRRKPEPYEGKAVAERAKAAGVKAVVLDRGGYQYHGRVRSLAEGAREGGLDL